MWYFECEHGQEAGVIGVAVWFFTPCVTCESALAAGRLHIPAQRQQRTLLAA